MTDPFEPHETSPRPWEGRNSITPLPRWSAPERLGGPDPSGGPPALPSRRVIGRANYWLHGGLFALTIVSTMLVGGPLYGLAIVLILLAHEMGHYLAARHYRVPATLPYFIPMPLTVFGTMGAVIRMDSVGQDRKVLFDIGVAGPIAGLVLSLPACLIGLSMSRVVETTQIGANHISLGSSLLFQWFQDLQFGHVPEGRDVLLHPVAFAGWAGLFVTALNLLPIGQLDGGHVVYALLGRRSRWLSLAVTAGFLAMAIFVSPTWLLMAVLLLVFGIRHPPTGDDTVPIDRGRRLIGVALMIVLVLAFTPKPFGP